LNLQERHFIFKAHFCILLGGRLDAIEERFHFFLKKKNDFYGCSVQIGPEGTIKRRAEFGGCWNRNYMNSGETMFAVSLIARRDCNCL